MPTSQDIGRLRDEVSRLRNYAMKNNDAMVLATNERRLALLAQLSGATEVEQTRNEGLIPKRCAMEISGKSRNTIKAWVERKLLNGYRSRANGELFLSEAELRELMETWANDGAKLTSNAQE